MGDNRCEVHRRELLALELADCSRLHGLMSLKPGILLGSFLFMVAAGLSAGAQGAGAQPVPGAIGPQPTLILLVNFEDKKEEPFTSAKAREWVFQRTAHYIKEVSYSRASLIGKVEGWFTLPIQARQAHHPEIKQLALDAAKKHGIDAAAYRHVFAVFPDIGEGTSSTHGVQSFGFINGSLSQSMAHELGHGLGLNHAHAWRPNGGGYVKIDRGDSFDRMGACCYIDENSTSSPDDPIYLEAHYSAFQKERLGWLHSDEIKLIEKSGTYDISCLETSPGKVPKALKIPKSQGSYYYVEYRCPLGFDRFIAQPKQLARFPAVLNGVILHTATEGDGTSSVLLDLKDEDPGLMTGQSFHDPVALHAFQITTLSTNDKEAKVKVQLGAARTAAPAPAPARLKLSPPTATLKPGATEKLTILLADENPRTSGASFTTAYKLTAAGTGCSAKLEGAGKAGTPLFVATESGKEMSIGLSIQAGTASASSASVSLEAQDLADHARIVRAEAHFKVLSK